ncbi:hypothetical protein JM47_02535 [Ureaplasma diversum]|uniref:Type I restriction modification DNA specificity domain-containing protein n=1 Tax=Ureaplasma diversum TaxID=42094 RepID=A0A0C5RPZ0_9BACT|nr:restriction endonuclease subunit S [Ureaplasma diversum]AJQ45439.1 hypothetical protein JM47_02535 [Ureaplasma diversum]
MENILELIKNEKVEWKRLGEVCEFKNGYAFNAKLFKESGSPIIRITNISKGKINFSNTKFFDLNDYPNLDDYKIYPDDIVVALSGATTGKIGLNYTDQIGYLNQRVGKFIPDKSILNNRFLFHFLFSNESYLFSLAKGTAGLPNLYKKDIDNILIPIPSLEVQEKVAEILDKFTEYITELQSELLLRNKQYNYYRDMLLSEEFLKNNNLGANNIHNYETKRTTLGEIGKFIRGNGLLKKDLALEGKPVIHYGQIYTKYGFETYKTFSFTSEEVFDKLKKAKKNDILIATTSENIKDVCKSVVWLGEEDIGFSGDMYCYRTSQNSKYIAYFLQSKHFQMQKERKVSGVKMIRLNSSEMEKFTITLPPLSIQDKIVEILDKLQASVEQTSGLIPKEIELRQKQYEYYRELLLSFDQTKN